MIKYSSSQIKQNYTLYKVSHCEHLRFSFIWQDKVRGQKTPTPNRKFIRWQVNQKIGLNQYNQIIYEQREKTRFKFAFHQQDKMNIIESPWIRVTILNVQGNFPYFLQYLQMMKLPQLKILHLTGLGISKKNEPCGINRCQFRSLRKVNFPKLNLIYLNWHLMETYKWLSRQLKDCHLIAFEYEIEDQFNFRQYSTFNRLKNAKERIDNPQIV